MIIGLTGTNASGKTSLVRFLISKGFEYHSLSDIIRDELTRQGLEHNRDNLRKVGNSLRIKYGAAILAQRIIEKMTSSKVVIDSIRNTSEVNELRKLKNFNLISVDAPLEFRFKRSLERGRNESAKDIHAFDELERKEKSKKRTSQNIDQCMAMADFSIYNDGSIQDLHYKIEKILQEIAQR